MQRELLNQYKKDGEVTTAKINLVDLAGSERVNEIQTLARMLAIIKSQLKENCDKKL